MAKLKIKRRRLNFLGIFDVAGKIIDAPIQPEAKLINKSAIISVNILSV
jgi:hypothetical protein